MEISEGYGARNVAPNIIGFEKAFKALLLNNYNSPHTNRANCEEDLNECLQSLDFFVTEQPETTSDISKDNEILCNKEILVERSEPDAGQKNYVWLGFGKVPEKYCKILSKI